ncbi:MAG TPA: FAD-binding protein, partial [Planctomycetes bacterium]|nr:FAD-binding protein [Planctomycetota bacterium]
MHLPKDLRDLIRTDVLLAPFTTFGIGGKAKYFAEVSTRPQAVSLFRWAVDEGIPVFPIGTGSNVLVADDGIGALVVRLMDDADFGRVDFGDEDG